MCGHEQREGLIFRFRYVIIVHGSVVAGHVTCENYHVLLAVRFVEFLQHGFKEYHWRIASIAPHRCFGICCKSFVHRTGALIVWTLS